MQKWLALVSSVYFFCAISSMELNAQVDPGAFVNYEIAPIHSMEMSPDGNTLACVNTADMRVEVYSIINDIPKHVSSISVGLEPTSVRFLSNGQLWVVNNLSDSISIIDVQQNRITQTLRTSDDPQDVVFAGEPLRAYVSCGLPRSLQVFDPSDLSAAPVNVPLQGNNPRALAVSPDGSKVVAAFFHSGNRTTILSGGMSHPNSNIANYPPDIVTSSVGPHGGVNPPPNSGVQFSPPRNLAAGTPPKVSMIVRQDAQGFWRDDTGANWTQWVSGANASLSGRYPGWSLIDHDLAVVDTNDLSVGYVSDLMNLCMALDVNPGSGHVMVVGTEAHNEIRFEPNIQAQFIDVVAASADPVTLQSTGRSDVNSDLVAMFSGSSLPETERAKAVGDPRCIQWNQDGSIAYIAGMGSNNVISVDSSGQRIGPVITVREGPVGLAIDEVRNQLYVQNRFSGSISVVDLDSGTETAVVTYFDPTPALVRTGRKHLYDTRHSSAIGQVACGSCHVDARMDRLSWDLGNPAGSKVFLSSRDLNTSFSAGTGSLTDFHPMKGPMLTQTLQDIIGHEPLHWRGDRFGIEEFNDAFHDLQGRASLLTSEEMAEFKAFLATIYFPPNPFRNLDNTLPTNLSLSGHFATGRFSLAAGAPLPAGNAVTGLTQYRNLVNRIDRGAFACVTCHTLPSGGSTDRRWISNSWQPIARGPNNENHLLVMGVSDIPPPVQNTVKVPHLRNIHERVGFNMRPGTQSLHGFGHSHDGNVPSIAEFLSEPAFNFTSDQQIANMVALMLSWSGSDFRDASGSLIVNPGNVLLEPPGVFSKDSHAGVGQQAIVTDPNQSLTRVNQLIAANSASIRIELIAKSYGPTGMRGYLALGNDFLADFPGEQRSLSELVANTGNGSTLVFTLVPAGTGQRLGRDRDLDGFLDYEELLNCTDPNDPGSYGVGGCASVVGGFVYHNSWTGNGSPIDTQTIVHREGQNAVQLSLENLSNSAAGIDGVGFDFDHLAIPTEVDASDFEFQISPQGAFVEASNPPPNWASAPVPISIDVTPGSPDRVIISWDRGAILNRWLRITIQANSTTGLIEPEVYYVGHLLGENTGPADGVFTVAFADLLVIRSGIGNSVDASSELDIDKNGIVAFADIAAMRANVGSQLTTISVSSPQ